jgi:hypothetical protein
MYGVMPGTNEGYEIAARGILIGVEGRHSC